MTAHERLRQAIDLQQSRLRAEVPGDREAAILAILHTRDRLAPQPVANPSPDLITGVPLADPGGNLALRLCLEAMNDANLAATVSETDIDHWAAHFLEACGWLAEAEMVLTHVETGFMRVVADGDSDFAAWIATKRAPASWQERADIAWWASWLARCFATPAAPPHDASRDDSFYWRIADVHLGRMAHQLGYPPDATIGGCTIQTYRDVLQSLIARALRSQDGGALAGPWVEHDLITAFAAALDLDAAVISQAVAAFTLDRENAAWHAAVPGVAAAPLVRIAPDRLAWSHYGLTTEPFFFLTRELRRRDPREYNNRAHVREDIFRQALYALFADRRFVTSPGRIALRREGGDLRTDVDAVVFDRKTGALGLFELKSQDPFARSAVELARQRDNLLYANRQLSGVLTWLNGHGADALLSRVDAQTAKRFRVQKVFPFVLGRYLAPAGDDPEPDRRAAWGSWPRVLRLFDEQRVLDLATPLAALHSRLSKDVPLIFPSGDAPACEIAIGPVRLTAYRSYAAFQAQASAADRRRSK